MILVDPEPPGIEAMPKRNVFSTYPGGQRSNKRPLIDFRGEQSAAGETVPTVNRSKADLAGIGFFEGKLRATPARALHRCVDGRTAEVSIDPCGVQVWRAA